MNAPPAAVATPVNDLGALMHVRRVSATAHYIAAAFLFLAPTALGIGTVLHQPSDDRSMDVFAIAITTGFGVLGAGLLLLKAPRRGDVIEAYEMGMRFTNRRGESRTFTYAEVRELRRQMFKGMLASITMVLADGVDYTIKVQGRPDLALVTDVLARFGPINWEADRGFRLM